MTPYRLVSNSTLKIFTVSVLTECGNDRFIFIRICGVHLPDYTVSWPRRTQSEYSSVNTPSPTGRYLRVIAGTRLQILPYFDFVWTTLMTYVKISWQSLIESRTACTFIKRTEALLLKGALNQIQTHFPRSIYVKVFQVYFPFSFTTRISCAVNFSYLIYISSPTHGSRGPITLTVLRNNLGACLPVVFSNVKPRKLCFLCGNKMPTRCNRGFYCRSYCLLNMFRASLCPSSGAQEYYTVVAACGILCCGFFK